MKKKIPDIAKVDVNRRQALGFFGGGAAAIATLPTPNLTTIKSGLMNKTNTDLSINEFLPDSDEEKEHLKKINDCKKALKFFTDNGIPQFKKDALKKESRDIYTIDPDIASLRSTSLVGKCNIQAKLNYSRAIENFTKEKTTLLDSLVHQIKHKVSIDIW